MWLLVHFHGHKKTGFVPGVQKYAKAKVFAVTIFRLCQSFKEQRDCC